VNDIILQTKFKLEQHINNVTACQGNTIKMVILKFIQKSSEHFDRPVLDPAQV
jgi:hypothetical protein